MAENLKGKKIALLVTDGYEESELLKPLEALKKAGAQALIVSPKEGEVRGWAEKDWGDAVKVDVQLDDADPEEFEGLVLPGGVMNPDKLRIDKDALEFIRHFYESGKPIAAICHGPWTLIEVGAANGRRMTSYSSIKTDLINAGAEWVDEEVVVDNGIVTSRSPDDLPAFCSKMLEEFSEGYHARNAAQIGQVNELL
jgi:protease I